MPGVLRDPRASTAALAVCVVVVATGVTWTYLGMRSVMDVGGSCASGGPYVSAQPCPNGAVLLAPAIPLMVLAALFGSLLAATRGAPGLLLPMWAALFGSLGWNFWEYGLTASDDGWVWSWIVCGAVFWAMAAPALYLLVTAGSGSWLPTPPQAAAPRAWWAAYAVLAAAGGLLGVVTFRALA